MLKLGHAVGQDPATVSGKWRWAYYSYLGGDAPGLVPVKSLLVDQQAHELRHGDGGVRVVHLEHRLVGQPLQVAVLLLVTGQYILQEKCLKINAMQI